MFNDYKKLLSFTLFLLLFISQGCAIYIEKISQPDKVKAGSEFIVRIDGKLTGSNDNSLSDKGFIMVDLPKNWEVKEAYFSGSYSGVMRIAIDDSTGSETTNKWKCTSTVEYPFQTGTTFQLYLKMKTSIEKGSYTITYYAGFERYGDSHWGPEDKSIKTI